LINMKCMMMMLVMALSLLLVGTHAAPAESPINLFSSMSEARVERAAQYPCCRCPQTIKITIEITIHRGSQRPSSPDCCPCWPPHRG
ncbi:hypothetical protein Hamer_G014912, partial [Homarus americanus]